MIGKGGGGLIIRYLKILFVGNLWFLVVDIFEKVSFIMMSDNDFCLGV